MVSKIMLIFDPESEDIMLDRLIIHIMLLLFLAPSVGKSQSVNKAELNHSRPMLNVSTNLLYDVVLAPSVRVETGIGNQLSIAVSGTYGWNEGWPWYENIRVVTADTEVRYWINHKGAEMMRRGLHIGIYGAVYRYDFLFGGKGQEAKANWGTGLTCGYSLPVSSDFSFDFNVGLGYIGASTRSMRSATTATTTTCGWPIRSGTTWVPPRWRWRLCGI